MSNQAKFYLGSYEVLGLLGKGGMGSVYLATDPSTQQKVAIKQLSPDSFGQDADLLERLKREGEALRLLNHPNIVKMLAVLEQAGQYALVLEYVEGGSLHDLLKKQPQLPLPAVLKIALELADALTRAHHLRIIHRDIKPANIMFARDGSLRLSDFGLARIDLGHNLTQSGVMIGSLAYLSPESIQARPVDNRSDIWAFGIVLYEMLAGQKPYPSDNMAVILNSILTQDPPDLAALRPDTPPRLLALVRDMLAKDPDLRVGTVRKVAAELEQIASDLGLQNPFPMPGDILSLIDRPATVESLSNASLFSPTPRSAADTFIQEGATLLAPRAKAARAAWANWAAVAALLFIFGLGLMWQFGRGEDGPAAESGPAEILTVEPVGPDEVMVLVAKTEALGPERPQIDRFLWENLNQPLELSAALTGLRLREYPQVIRSEAEARQAAQKNGAALVIWGTYDQSFIDLNLSSFALMPAPLPESSLQKAANLRARLSDERSQSLAPQVLISTTVWYAYHSQPFEAAATMVAYYDLDLRPAETFGVSTGAEVYRHYENLYDDPQAATDFMTKALQGDPQNPLLYHLRAAAVDRTGNMEQALEDVETAQLLSQAAWPLPFLNEANLRSSQGDLAGGIAALTQAIALDPQEWLFYAVRGSYFYLDGDLAAAEADFRAAIERDPQANFPYVLLMNSSIQSGDIGEVQTLMATILEKFPDPTLGNRIILTAGNQPEFGGYYSLTLSAFNNLVLRQYGASLQDVQAALEIQPDSPDLHLFEGVVQCALGDLAAAEAAYSRGLEYKPDMTVLYLLRADVRNRLGDGAGGLEDFIAARQTTAWPNFEALVNEALAGGEGLGCESFFEVPG